MTNRSVRSGIGAERFRSATGTAATFQSIDGVGRKTAEKVKGVFGVDAPRDVADKTAQELASEAGISESRARKVIVGAGGNPDIDESPQTTSVSAAGIRVPTGEFRTEISDKDKAEAKVDTSLNRGIGRSQNAAIADKAKRAPVTTDYERWKENKGSLDYPGADTPTDDPQVLPKDLKQEQRPATTEPDDPPRSTRRVPESPNVERNTNAPEQFTSALGRQDVSLSFEEAFEGVASGSFTTTRRSPDSGYAAGLASGDEAESAFSSAEQERGEPSDRFSMSGGERRRQFDLPDETLSFARTQLNKKVYSEGRDDLDDLRERVTPGEPVELDRSEFRTVKNVVFDAADGAKDRAERMDRNIFGDTDEQAAFAETARQGIISNPFSSGGGER